MKELSLHRWSPVTDASPLRDGGAWLTRLAISLFCEDFYLHGTLRGAGETHGWDLEKILFPTENAE